MAWTRISFSLPKQPASAADATEMGVDEASRIFEAIAKRTIETDVGGPNEGDGDCRLAREESAGSRQNERRDIGVDDIVGRRPDARPRQVAEHAEIGGEEENHEQRPREAGMGIEADRSNDGRQAFQPEYAAHGPSQENCPLLRGKI